MFGFLHLPDRAIAGNKIDKKALYENADLSMNEKRWLKDDVERITWEYRIANDTVNIRGFVDDSVDYSEIQVIGITLRIETHARNIADLMLRSMPYPLIVIMYHEEKVMIVGAHVHINQNDRSRLTVEEPVRSKWLSVDDNLLEILDMSSPGSSDLRQLYKRFIDSLMRLNISEERGSETVIEAADSKQVLDRLSSIDQDIRKLTTELRNEDHFNRQVELNGRIKKLQMERSRLLDTLGKE